MKNKWREYSRIRVTLQRSFAAIAVITSALLALSLFLAARNQMRQDVRKRLRDVVNVASSQIDGDLHSTLIGPSQEDSPQYTRVKHTLQHIREKSDDFHFVYTWRLSDEGQLVFVVDAETDPEEISHLGDIYDADETLLALLSGIDGPKVDKDFVSDKWGTFLSGYAPFYSSDGKLEGILGIDIEASTVVGNERRFLWITVFIFGITIPFALLLGRLLGRKVTSLIVALTQGSDHIKDSNMESGRIMKVDYEDTQIDRRRLNISLAAIILGSLSVISALSIGYVAYRRTIKTAVTRYHNSSLAKVKMLSAEHKSFSDADFFESIKEHWAAETTRAPDEYICVVDKDSRLILHTAHPETIGNCVGDNELLATKGRWETCVKDVVSSGRDYVGGYISSSGQEQIVAFSSIPNRQWVMGVHRSKAALMKEVYSGISDLMIGFGVICGALMPISLLLIGRTFYVLRQRHRRVEYAIRSITEGTARTTGEDFICSLIEHFAKTIDFKYFLVGEVLQPDMNRVRTLAIWENGDFRENVEYELAGTPCEHTAKKSFCFYPKNVQQLFPEDHMLVEMKAVSYIGVPFFDADGNLLGILAALDDRPMEDRLFLTSVFKVFAERVGGEIERKQAEENLRNINQQLEASTEKANLMAKDALAANETKGQFLANMSHEIRTPMNAIIGFSEMLTTEDLPQEQEECVKIINDSGKHLLALIDDILDFSKIEAGKMDIEIADCSVAELLKEVEILMRPTADERGLVFEIKQHKPLPQQIKTDSLRLRQCLINLVNNAVKFTEAGHVLVHVSQQSDKDGETLIRFDVEDTGIGIAPEKQKAILESFTQADGSTTRQYGGTGLGLAITKRLAELLDGRLIVTSEEGKGSVISIIIPAGVDPAGQQLLDRDTVADHTDGYKERQEQPKFSGHVLVVEDVKTNQMLCKFLLNRMGLEVTIVEDGNDAVQKALAGAFDMILMDIQMPNMNGYEATKALREKGITTPIVALTANAMDGDDKKCIDAGCDGYLAKPFDRRELSKIVGKYLSLEERASIKKITSGA